MPAPTAGAAIPLSAQAGHSESKMNAILLACFLFFCARHHHHVHHRHYVVHSHHYARPLPSLADQPPPAAGKTLAPGNNTPQK
jgi:hypothetical protein